VKAAVYRRYGPPDVIRIENVPTPDPGPNELLVRVRAASVSAGAARLRSARVLPLRQGTLADPGDLCAVPAPERVRGAPLTPPDG
jgi:NADPH:quinone reductase-like Zn-dependent oxidoreductase